MTTTEPTTCTGCGKVFDAPILVAAFDSARRCAVCQLQAAWAWDLSYLDIQLAEARATVVHWEQRIAAHKAAHPPLVEEPEPAFLEMDGPIE